MDPCGDLKILPESVLHSAVPAGIHTVFDPHENPKNPHRDPLDLSNYVFFYSGEKSARIMKILNQEFST